jgi:hypothetical protein
MREKRFGWDEIARFSIMSRISLILLIGLISYFRIVYSSPFARSWDQVDFALAVHRFDLLAMQPHFPGYPYFVLGGMIVNQWVDDPSQALSIFNTGMLLLATLPMYWMARRYLAQLPSLLVCTAGQSLAYLWIMATEPMSEAAAVSVLWWYLWSLQRAMEGQLGRMNLLPLFIFSMLMGIRLSYLPFGLGLIILVYSKRKFFSNHWGWWKYGIKQAAIAILFQVIWVVGLIATEGNIRNFITLAFQFVFGHFNDWGGAVTAESTPLLQRFVQLLFVNIFWVGICGESLLTACLLGLLLIFTLISGIKFKSILSPLPILIGSYFLWALFAQNIDKPRHALPLIVLLFFFIILAALKSEKYRVINIVLLLGIICIQAFNGYGFVKEKTMELPATYQLTNYLKEYKEPFVVYTWEEARIMEYLEAEFPYERLQSYDYFASNIQQRGSKKILVTDHVLKGFEQQGIHVTPHIKKLKTFQSNPLFDPVYHTITLYEWEGGGGED